MTLEASTILSRSHDKLASEIDGEFVLICIDDGRYYGLDDIGSMIWRKLDQPARVDVLCDMMTENFEGDRETITRDTVAFLEQLVDRELLVIS